ncbi:MAG: hypothetical protein R3C59_06875 [Planctomycetaceae bacterium]
MRLNDEILHGEVFVAEKLCSLGQICQRQRDRPVDCEISGLAAFGRTGLLAIAFTATLLPLRLDGRRFSFSPLGSVGGRGFSCVPFRLPDFLFEPLDLPLLLINDVLLLRMMPLLPDQRVCSSEIAPALPVSPTSLPSTKQNKFPHFRKDQSPRGY